METTIFRSKAPLRISFSGGGTDISPYPELHGGVVISTSIDMYSYTSIEITKKHNIVIHSLDYNIKKIISNKTPLNVNGKLKLIFSILNNFNFNKHGLDITLFSDVNVGSGLGSSSSLTIALLGNMLKIFNLSKSKASIAKLAYQIERLDCGIKGGYQDQYSASYGGFNFIEFSKNQVKVSNLNLAPSLLNELHGNFILCDTGIRRKNKVYEKIIQTQSTIIEENSSNIDILHNIKKITLQMRKALLTGNLDQFAELLHESWLAKMSIDSNISSREISQLYNFACKNGAKGGKLLGAGGGGFMLLYCDLKKKTDLIKKLSSRGYYPVKFNFENNGLQTWSISNGKINK